MKHVFADTFYFLALLNPADAAHGKAVAFTSGTTFRLTTTAWVITELADALASSPRGRAEFLGVLAELQSTPDATIVPPEPALMNEGVKLYRERADKNWSLTDCISFVCMNRLGLTEALTGDHHFEQAGFVVLLK